MKISVYNTYSPYLSRNKVPHFGSTARSYADKSGLAIGNHTSIYRNDIEWDKLAEYIVKNFKDKEKVNIEQYACSDGSESYTIILSLLKAAQNKNIRKFFPIKAFDIDNEVITKAAQEGIINLEEKDLERLKTNGFKSEEFFTKSDKRLWLKQESLYFTGKTYNVSQYLQDKVMFDKGNMFVEIGNLKDNSNTVLFCRNILLYMDDCEHQYFIEKAGEKLKKGSLLVIGTLDRDSNYLEKYLHQYGFAPVMKNVYKKMN